MKYLSLALGFSEKKGICKKTKGSGVYKWLQLLMSAGITFSVLIFSPRVFSQEALPNKPPTPSNNPTTNAKVELGKALFFDLRFSADGSLGCISCHNLSRGGDDGRPVAVGFRGRRGRRNTLTVWNAAFMSVQGWVGQFKTLEDQALIPFLHPDEMGLSSTEEMLAKIKSIPGYQKMFDQAFGKKKGNINLENVGKAIAAFERTLITPSRFDRYMNGDKLALTLAELKGFETMKQVGCFTCHSGPNFAGPQLKFGKGFFQKFPANPHPYFKFWDDKYKLTQDTGRYAVTNNPKDKNVWRVPSLRNVELTAPYFHNGSVTSLKEAILIMAEAQLGITLTYDQVESIEIFLKTLTGDIPKIEPPKLP